jgi:ABC-2 type transport system permease protein
LNNPIGTYYYFRKETTRFLRVWKQTILSPMISTMLYFIVFAPIFGDRVVLGVPYLVFIAPGLIMMGMITNAFSNGASSLVIAKYSGTITDIPTLPLTPFELTLAYAASSTLRGLLVGIATIIPIVFFINIPFSHVMLLLTTTILTCFLFGAFGSIVGLWAKDFDSFSIVQNFAITPLIFLGGVFYSIQNLPPFFQTISFYNPLTHIIDLLRYGMIGVSDYPWQENMIFLILLTTIIGAWNYRLFKIGYKIKT